MDEVLMSEKGAASRALSGWRELLSLALRPPAGELCQVNVLERLRSLEAAWARYDKCHMRLLTQTAMSEALKAAEEKDWEARLEEYCRAREEGVEVLKELGHTDFQAPDTVAFVVERHRELLAASGPSRTERVHYYQQQQESPTRVGCFHRPKLPEEVLRESAVRDDLVISGHKDYNSLYAANDTVQEKFTVNILGAPNNSTTTCGCDNINCPFCNLVLSITNRDPSLY